MKVSDVMIKDFGTVAPDETLDLAARLMADLDTDVLPVGAGSTLAGILTGRDIVLRAVAQGKDPRITLVAEVMSSQLCTCRPEDALEDVRADMEVRRIRRMPVVDANGEMIGMVSLFDIVGSA